MLLLELPLPLRKPRLALLEGRVPLAGAATLPLAPGRLLVTVAAGRPMLPGRSRSQADDDCPAEGRTEAAAWPKLPGRRLAEMVPLPYDGPWGRETPGELVAQPPAGA